MARKANPENLWGTGSLRPTPRARAARSDLGAALLAIAQPDLFGTPADRDGAARLLALRRRRARTWRRAAAMSLLAEPWTIDRADAPPGAVALARRFLRRHPEHDRADPAPPLLSARQEAAAWHAEEAMAEDEVRRDAW